MIYTIRENAKFAIVMSRDYYAAAAAGSTCRPNPSGF